MRNGVSRVIAAFAVVAACAAFVPSPASARVVVGFRFGAPLYAPFVPAPVYYYPPPPVYYAPPPVAYYAPPPAYEPAPASAPAAAASSGQCREYSTTTVISGSPQEVYGTACLQSDGTWRIVH